MWMGSRILRNPNRLKFEANSYPNIPNSSSKIALKTVQYNMQGWGKVDMIKKNKS